MNTRTIPHTRRRGAFDSRPILCAMTLGLAAWAIAILGFHALAGVVRGSLALFGGW